MPENTIYNTIGTGYNHSRRADPYITGRLLALLQAVPGGGYLDIGCGTGNYTIALAAAGLGFTGVDPSEVMLLEARALVTGLREGFAKVLRAEAAGIGCGRNR